MPRRLATNRPVYLTIGRVTSALFTCPVCSTPIRYIRRVGFRIRCPLAECRQQLAISLNVCMVREGKYSRPPDTLIPGQPLPPVYEPDPATTGPSVPLHSVPPLDPVPVLHWQPGTPFHTVTVTETRLSSVVPVQTPPQDDDQDQE